MLILLLKTLLRYCMFLFIFCETSHGRHLIYPISVLIHFIVITNVCILIVFTKFRKNVMGSFNFSLPEYTRIQNLAYLLFHTLLDLFTQSYFLIIYIYGNKEYPVLYHFTCKETFVYVLCFSGALCVYLKNIYKKGPLMNSEHFICSYK